MVWDREQDWQCVSLGELALEVRLGVYASERDAPQRIVVAVDLFRHVGAYRGGGLAECLDYDRIYRHLTETWPSRPHIALLEELVEDLVGTCFADSRVEACRVRVTKPDIYGGRALPSVEVYRRRPPA
jgi:dihydroneopterin aldolase